jgi:PAS domain S-box-containing protein
MAISSILLLGRRRARGVWADLPLRGKGLVVVAIPLAALLASTASFYLIQRQDREADALVERSAEVAKIVESCLARSLDAESAVHEYLLTGRQDRLARRRAAAETFKSELDALERLLWREPLQLRRVRRVRLLYQDEARIWDEMSRPAGGSGPFTVPRSALLRRCEAGMDALEMELRSMRGEQENLLVARVQRVAQVRRQALAAVAGNALLGLTGGLLAILLFTSGVARAVERLQRNAARLEQRLPMFPPLRGRDELGCLARALENAGASLHRSEGERDRIFTLSLDMLCIATLDGRFKRVNPAFTRMLGYPETELLAAGILDFVHPDDRATAVQQLQDLARGNPVAYLETRFCCKDGSYKWLAWSIAPFLAEGLAYAVARDRTRQKLDEQALRKSNARLACVLESITDAFFAVDCGYRLTYVNPEAERLWTRHRQDLLGRNLWEVFPEAAGGPFHRIYDQALRTGRSAHLEGRFPPFDRWLEVHVYPSVEGLSVYFRDVTERREADERIRRALKEKEVLLREIHHRVKNNLQVISSLLRLQAGYVRDDTLRQVLNECHERVHAMAILHDQLHRVKDLSSVDLGGYIRTLTAGLFSSYGVNSAQIALRLDLEAITVPFDAAIPCGLIVNELVSNAIRHAFPEGRKGRISLGLHLEPGGEIELSVCDDGRGFPDSAPAASVQSLGLRLVHLLAEQMEASVEHSIKAGTEYRLVFKCKANKGEQSNE